MNEPQYPRIQVQDTKGTSFAVQFDHFDVSGDEWMKVFRLILMFLTFHPDTITELLDKEE